MLAYREGVRSGTAGTSATDAGTSGGWNGTDGDRRRAIAAGVALFALVVSLRVYGEGTSRLADLARNGVAVPAWTVWTAEATSIAALLALTPALWRLVARARPPRFGWPSLLAIYAGASVVFSLAHVGGMVALRALAHAAMGERYALPDPGAQMLYEYRKDVATFVQLAALAALAQWWLARANLRERLPRRPDSRLLLVADGAVTHRIPLDEIDHLSAAGNYVELHWRGRALLHRATLAAMDTTLGDGFVRIHRSRMVRRDAIRSITGEKSGDFAVILADGSVVRGSRRYRLALDGLSA